MAVVRARSSPPYGLIFTIIVAVVAVGLAVFFGLKWSKAEETRVSLENRISKLATDNERTNVVPTVMMGVTDRNATAVGEMQKQLNALKTLTFGSASGDMTKTANDALAAVKAKGQNASSLLAAVTSLTNELSKQTANVDRLNADMASLRTEVDNASKASAARTGTDQQANANLQTRMGQVQAELSAALAARDKAVADGQDALNKLIASNEESVRDKVIQIEQLKSELTKSQVQIADLLLRIRGPVVNVSVGEADGTIIRVNAAAGECYITLTAKDGMKPGLPFTVHDPRLGVRYGTDEAAMGNGSIEVIEVGETSSLCRITRVTKDHAIQPGDLISNIIYHNDKNRKFRFVVYGDFDLDGDGRYTAAERDRLTRMIATWGGQVDDAVTPQTDFLVMGERPAAPTVVEEPGATTTPGSIGDQRKQVQNQYDDLVIAAKRLSIPVLNANRFLAMVGYYNTTVIRR